MFSPTRPVYWLTAAVAACLLVIAGIGRATETPTDQNAPKPATDKKAESAPPKPNVLVTISKETTYITEPLRPDGYPDYCAALNRRAGQDITPENNAAVLFCRAFGPNYFHTPSIREKYFKLLSIPLLPNEGDYFIIAEDFFERERKAGRLTASKNPKNDEEEALQQIIARPWSKKEFPHWARWLEVNKKPLALLVEATKRPRCYGPLLTYANGCLEHSLLTPAANQADRAATALAARAMLRTHGGDFDGAWQDLLACHRLARLESQGSIVEGSIGLWIDGKAMACEAAMIQRPSITIAQIAKMRADLAKLPSMPKIVDKIDWSDRITCLDFVCFIARDGLSTLNKLYGNGASVDSLQDVRFHSIDAVVNWDVPLRISNFWYDRIVNAARKSTRAERVEAWQKINNEILQNIAKIKESSHGTPPVNPSQAVGQTIVAILLPQGWGCCQAEDRWTMKFQVNELAFALAVYRVDHGMYPNKLADLLPKYMVKIPKDMFNNDADLHYTRHGDGCLLYSVGPDGMDNGGKGEDVLNRKDTGEESLPGWREVCDDIGVQLGTEHP